MLHKELKIREPPEIITLKPSINSLKCIMDLKHPMNPYQEKKEKNRP